MRTAIKKSCDVYFYEVARRLGIDSLAKTAKEFGLGKKILEGYNEEKAGVVPGTKWKLKKLGKNWYLGETLHSGIGQGYFLPRGEATSRYFEINTLNIEKNLASSEMSGTW